MVIFSLKIILILNNRFRNNSKALTQTISLMATDKAKGNKTNHNNQKANNNNNKYGNRNRIS